MKDDTLQIFKSPRSQNESSEGYRRNILLSWIRPWHIALFVTFIVLSIVLLYAFWPVPARPSKEHNRLLAPAATDTTHVGVIVVEKRDFPLRTDATGHLAPWRKAIISTETSGIIVDRPVEEGEWVQAGTVLLQLDDQEALINLAEAEADLLKARATFAVNTSSKGDALPEDTTQLGSLREDLHKAEEAFDRGLLSHVDLQAMRRRLATAQVLSGSQREAVQAVISGLTQAEQRVERARLALTRTQVRAPFSGRIADLEVEVGQRLSVGQSILTLLDDKQMKVDVDVLEADLVRLHKGATADVRVPSHDDAIFSGNIYSINPRVEPQKGTGRVTVAIPNADGRLVTGLFSYVELETQQLENALVIPVQALLVRQGRDLVFCIQDGRAQWTYVNVGVRSGNEVEILSGLATGDTVAVAGHFALAHDVPVAASFSQIPSER